MITPHLKSDVILSRISSTIPSLGVASRKILLGICQVEEDVEESEELVHKIRAIQLDLETRQQNDVPSLFDLGQFSVHIASRPIYRSFISMMVRNEALDQFAGADETIREGFIKEFSAGQQRRDEEYRISYQVLDQDNFAPAAYSIYYPIAPSWTGRVKNLVQTFSSRLQRMGIVYPQVQRRKNMSRDTCRSLALAGYSREGCRWEDFTTLDLEKHKLNTGEMVQGDCEMRMAWKFNELKPRFYYCTGGTMYWESRFMKPLAVELMESVPSTRLQRRQHPEDIGYALEDEDYLTLWDMSAFTSSLSELKYFLYYLVKNMEEDLFIQQRPLEVWL